MKSARTAATAPTPAVRENVTLAPYSTLQVGGPARFFVEAGDEATAVEALEWAERRHLSCHVLGGGSNLVIADDGVDGLVLRIALRGVRPREAGGVVEVTAAAGEPWDELVSLAVRNGWAGLECLSGIPGLVGATPIQNVGAYGQEVSDTIRSVRVYDRVAREAVTLPPEACRFAYRDSLFKSIEPDRYVVLAVTYGLVLGGAPTVRYAELQKHLADRNVTTPSLADVRESVLSVRRGKSMVLDPHDPNRRSCGSFFTNPIVTAEMAATVEGRAGREAGMPAWPQPDGRVKLSAAWLIQRAGLHRGERDGAVGLSSRHTLAIVAHEGARARDVVAFAGRVRGRVRERFGVTLVPEPVFWGDVTLD